MDKRATAARVLSYRVNVVGSGGGGTYPTRTAADDEARRLRARGLAVQVRPVSNPLPGDPWLCIDAHPPVH